MAVEIGALRALLSLDSAAFDKGAKRAQASMTKLQRGLTRASENMRRVGRKMTTRVTLPLAGLATVAVRSSLKTIDAQSKMAQSLDTSTRSMQVLARASDRAGISTGELEQISRQLTKRLSQAASGTGAAVKPLERMGIAASDLSGLDLDQKIAVINRAIEETIPAAEQAAVAAAIFGDRAGLLASRLDSDTIATAADEIERFGIAVTEVEADKIEEANDAISAIALVTRGLANQLAVALAPTLKTIAERIADIGVWFSSLSPEMKRFVGIAAVVAAAIGPLAVALGFVAAGMAALASPIGLAVLAFGAVAGAAAYVATRWDELKARFPILERVANLGEKMKEAWDDLPAIKWALLIPALRWARFIPGLRWARFIPNIAWLTLAGALRWTALIGKLSWAALRVIPGIGWAALAGTLAWKLLVKKIEWDGWIPKVHWADWIEKINWSDWIPTIDWDRIFGDVDPGQEAIERAKQRAIDAGADIGNGLRQGILETKPAAEQDIRDYLDDMEGAAREQSETQSPSKVWMRLGRDLMGGLAIGIDGGAQTAAEAAARAAEDVTEKAKQATSGIGSIATRAGSAVSRLFDSIISGGQDAISVLQDLGIQLLKMALFKGLKNILPGIFGEGGIIQLPSFDGGGSTGHGARSGGVDGKGGFPAILHPNETVVDHTKTSNRNSGLNVEFRVVNNSGGAEVKQRRERGPDGREVLIAEVNDAAQQGRLTGIEQRFGAKTRVKRR